MQNYELFEYEFGKILIFIGATRKNKDIDK